MQDKIDIFNAKWQGHCVFGVQEILFGDTSFPDVPSPHHSNIFIHFGFLMLSFEKTKGKIVCSVAVILVPDNVCLH